MGSDSSLGPESVDFHTNNRASFPKPGCTPPLTVQPGFLFAAAQHPGKLTRMSTPARRWIPAVEGLAEKNSGNQIRRIRVRG